MFAMKFYLLLSCAFFFGVKGFNHCGSGIPCEDSYCIERVEWCDAVADCPDQSDEKYCRRKGIFTIPDNGCDTERYFTCENRMCIPNVLRCDGFHDCPDNSDEENCCRDIDDTEGSIRRQIPIGGLLKHNECWKFTLKEDEKLLVYISAHFYGRDCNYGNITLEEDKKTGVHVRTICPTLTDPAPLQRKFIFLNDVKINYNSFFPLYGSVMDIFNITYDKTSDDCRKPDMIKCSKEHCVSTDKRCDGIKDCINGVDEKNCGFVALSEDFFEDNRKFASRWMRSQHDADWGWKDNTPRAVIALYLSNDLNFNSSSHDDDLIAKQLELEVSTFLLRHTVEKAPITEMATYINALQAICHNPRNFYGFDLVQKMKHEIEEKINYVTAFPYLTLCNAKESVSKDAIDKLLQIINKPSDFGFALEIQALASMTLSCISKNHDYVHLKQNLTEHLNSIKKKQKEDGSFGNEYTTALVIQALITNNQGHDRDWKFEASAEFLKKKQKPDGSFGDFLTTYLIMPVMNGRSLVDLSRVNCTERQNRPREANPASDIKNRLGGKIPVKYSLVIGDEKDQVLPILLRTPENITVLELMTLAADIDPKFKFKTHQMEEKTYVYEISSIPNDPEKNKFWFLYQQIGNNTVPVAKQSPDAVYVGENYHMIMWYKTLVM